MPRKYLFADESGNFDFRDHTEFKNGPTKYFAVGTLMIEGEDTVRALRNDLLTLRDTLVSEGVDHHGPFHCTEDSQEVRDAVFEVLQRHPFRVDVTLLEKSKALPRLYVTEATFYKYAWFFHFKWFANRYFKPDDELFVVSAALGTKKTRAAFRAAVEDVVRQCCNFRVKRHFGHYASASDPCLQAVDYVLWAVMRDIERGDSRSRDLIAGKIASVYDLFSIGRVHHYGPKANSAAKPA